MSEKTVADYVREYNRMVEEAGGLGLRGYRLVSNSTVKNLEDARRRCESIASSLRAFRAGQVAADNQEHKETAVAKKQKKAVKSRRTNGGSGAMRAGSTSAKILSLCDGTRSLSQIQSRIDAKSPVTAYLACMKRDYHIDYDLNGGKPKVILPHGKKLEDMVR